MELALFIEVLIETYRQHHKTQTGQCSCKAEICLTGPWVERELSRVGLEPEYRDSQGTTT